MSDIEQIAKAKAAKAIKEALDKAADEEWPADLAGIVDEAFCAFRPLISAAEAKGRSQGAADMQERAKAAILEEMRAFSSEEYATPQPLGSLSEVFACRECHRAVEALPLKEPA